MSQNTSPSPIPPPAPRVDISLTLAPGSHLRVTIEADGVEKMIPVEEPKPEPAPLVLPAKKVQRHLPRLKTPVWLNSIFSWKLPEQLGFLQSGRVLFMVVLLLYTISHFGGLADYPAQFLVEETTNTLLLRDLQSNNWVMPGGIAFQPFFLQAGTSARGLGVYAAYLLQGTTLDPIVQVRALSALFSLLTALFTALWLRDGLRLKTWWLAVPVLGCFPGWFFLSRLGVDGTGVAACWAGMLCCAAWWKNGKPAALSVAVLLGFASVWFWPPALPAVLACLLIGAVLEYRLLVREWKSVLPALGLVIVMAAFNTRWLASLPILWGPAPQNALANWLRLINPVTWFGTDPALSLALRPGIYSAISPLLLPFVFGGVAAFIYRRRPPALLVALAATLPALVCADAYAILWLVYIPLAVLICAGLDEALNFILHKTEALRWLVQLLVTLAFAAAGIIFWQSAVTDGARWIEDYSAQGTRYGAPQVLEAARQMTASSPGLQVFIAPGVVPDMTTYLRFFFPNQEMIHEGLPGSPEAEEVSSISQIVYVLPANQLDPLTEQSGYSQREILLTILYPDQNPAFFFVTLNP